MLDVENISYSIQDFNLSNARFSLQENKCLGVIGANGAGKSTLLNLIAGFLNPISGSVAIDKVSPQLWDDYRKKVILLNDKSFLIEELRVIEMILLYSYMKGISKKNCIEKIEKFRPYFFHKDSFLEKKITSLSLGMRKKLELMLVLTWSEQPYILLDEPFNSLDPLFSLQLVKLIQKMKQLKTFVVSSHSLEYLDSISDDILIIENGLVQYITQDERQNLYQKFLNQPQSFKDPTQILNEF